MDGRTYSINRSSVTIRFGDITDSQAEVLVSSDDGNLLAGGGVSRAISNRAGGRRALGIDKLVPARVGDVVVSSAGELSAKYVLHAITLPALEHWTRSAVLPAGVIVRQVVRRAMELVPLLNCHSVAFPAIGAGVAGIPFETVASEMAEVIVANLLDDRSALAVEFFLLDRFNQRSRDELLELFETQMMRTLGVRAARRDDSYVFEPPTASSANEAKQSQQGDTAQRRLAAFEMLRQLDRRRSQLESDLVASFDEDSPATDATIAALRSQLTEIRGLRKIYEEELGLPSRGVPQIPDSVFVSSTYVDLRPYREGLRSLIERLSLTFLGMEDFVPEGQPPGEYIRKRVDESEIFLGVLGMRYGSVEPNSGLSMTELEYRQALASGKNRLMFVLDDHAPITVDMIETNPQSYLKLLEFRAHVRKHQMCDMFRDLDDLTKKAEKAIRAYKVILPT